MTRKRKQPVIELSSDEELSPPRPRNKRRAKVGADSRPGSAVNQLHFAVCLSHLQCEAASVVRVSPERS